MNFFDPILLARIQFAFTVSFHIIFPALSIGLASFLAFVEWRYLKTNNQIYRDIYKFLIKIFAVSFGMGVVSGVVMSYQFGTNWSVFSDRVSNVLGPLLGFEVLTAFFLEASFLGIMLFGWGKVSKKMHFASTVIVAIGTVISAFWILSANSWMQTPQGFTMLEDGRLYPTNWLEIIFNPSFPYRFTHMLLAAYLTTAFVVGGIASYYLIGNRFKEQAKIMLKLSVIMAAILSPIQMFVGDLHGLNTLKHQPAKIAAIEGIWETEQGAGLRLFAHIDEENEKNHISIEIPKLASFLLTHDFNGEVKGLKEWDKSERPPVTVVFWAFRVMVGLGMLMIAISLFSLIQHLRKKLFDSRFLQRCWIVMSPAGFIALLAGWFVTEIGRQPYVAYGIIRTAESVSPAILGPQVAWSLISFILIYTIIFGAAIYYIFKLIRNGFVGKDSGFYGHGVEASVLNKKSK